MSEWQPIETAPKETGKEILGVRFIGTSMLKEPFVTFWSPMMGKFYCNPTHWIPLPDPPKEAS